MKSVRATQHRPTHKAGKFSLKPKHRAKANTARQAALDTLYLVIFQQESLSKHFSAQKQQLPAKERALYHTLVYDSLRQHAALSRVRDGLLTAKLEANAQRLSLILNLGILQLLTLNLGDHGVINETVALASHNQIGQCKGLINAVLRRVQSERESLKAKLARAQSENLPKWLSAYYPHDIRQLTDALTHAPPLTLRLSPTLDKAAWIEQTEGVIDNPLAPDAVSLSPARPVEAIAGFAEGNVSVQDATAQWAALLLAPKNGERILDACAAPGGKTGHLLELAPQAQVIALDHDAQRLARVQENLTRLRKTATLIAADAAKRSSWYDDQPFDAILLDAPCSGSGVLRRHPDILFVRRQSDFAQLAQQQSKLLKSLWPCLKAGGRLLYVTCSIIPEENQNVIRKFLATHPDASLSKIDLPKARDSQFGLLHLPDAHGDGFFYALLRKAH